MYITYKLYVTNFHVGSDRWWRRRSLLQHRLFDDIILYIYIYFFLLRITEETDEERKENENITLHIYTGSNVTYLFLFSLILFFFAVSMRCECGLLPDLSGLTQRFSGHHRHIINSIISTYKHIKLFRERDRKKDVIYLECNMNQNLANCKCIQRYTHTHTHTERDLTIFGTVMTLSEQQLPMENTKIGMRWVTAVQRVFGHRHCRFQLTTTMIQ